VLRGLASRRSARFLSGVKPSLLGELSFDHGL